MSSDLNRALRSAGPREIAPLSLTEVKSRASRWRIQRFALMGAAASLVIAGAVGAWAAIDVGGGTPAVPVAPNEAACVAPDHDIALFLFDEVTLSQVRMLQEKIGQLHGVEDVVFVSKLAAYEEFKKHYEDQPEFFENLPENALPASLRVTLAPDATAADARRATQDARALPGVQDVRRAESPKECPRRDHDDLNVDRADAEKDLVAVPDLIGVSFREACNNVEGELILRVENSSTTETCDSGSIVTAQEPKPGTHVEPGTGIAITLSPIKEPPDENDRVLDGLIIELRVEEEMVQPGATVRSTLIVENPTDEPIVDPQCYLASPTFGIVKSVDAELWQAHVVDCGARLTIAPGEMKRMTGPDFIATDGMDPLEPGSYLAVVELRGRTERLSLPIEVVE